MKVIITGASRGIGEGIAKVLGSRGHEIGLLARSAQALEEIASTINSDGGAAYSAKADLRSAEETSAAIETLTEQLGGVDALINNAGIVLRKSIFDITLEDWQAVMETNLNGVFYAVRTVLPKMRSAGRGHIINVSSISGRLPLADGSAYAASKYAVTGFSESLFLEVRNYGIKVTTIFPGSVDTRSHASGNDSWKLRPEEVGEACAQALETSERNCISRIELRPLRAGG